MKRIIMTAVCAVALVGYAMQYSCLSIITESKKIGKWDALKAWIADAGLKDEWDKCSYLSDDYPQYSDVTNALVMSGVLTEAEIDYVLTRSVDPAISDEMIRRVVSNDCNTAEGRKKWHGKVVSNTIDTNALTVTQIHDDGYTYVARFKSVSAMPLEEHLSTAEKKAKREAEARARKEAEARAKAKRIAELTTNMTCLAESLAARKKYPIDLATMLLQHELNQLIGTNEVNAVITPLK